ncbi:MAG: UbiA prenyltransferase family protein [Bacteroidia bacterium]
MTFNNINNFSNALTLMRIPFSIFLMPIFWFALLAAESPWQEWDKIVLIFFILHILVYPASNGYNSYFDKDEGAIGGLEKPPTVNKELFYLVCIFDILAIALSLTLSLKFAIGIIAYTLMSKAYSWDKIRLKKHPIISTLVVTFFQGFTIYWIVNLGINDAFRFNTSTILYAMVSTLFLMGSYPITQIYQHQEDAERGDKTISLMLGVNGTFIFSGFLFALATGLMAYGFFLENEITNLFIFMVATAPVILFFTSWVIKVRKDPSEVNFKNTMKMNKISSICLSAAFILMNIQF